MVVWHPIWIKSKHTFPDIGTILSNGKAQVLDKILKWNITIKFIHSLVVEQIHTIIMYFRPCIKYNILSIYSLPDEILINCSVKKRRREIINGFSKLLQLSMCCLQVLKKKMHAWLHLRSLLPTRGATKIRKRSQNLRCQQCH